MFLAGRFLTGLGCTTAAAAAKSYVSHQPFHISTSTVIDSAGTRRWPKSPTLNVEVSTWERESRSRLTCNLSIFQLTQVSELLDRLNSFYYIGQILASGITIPTGRYANDWSWRAPLYVSPVLGSALPPQGNPN
jgi:hypothetical protein